jgi:cytochrome P450
MSGEVPDMSDAAGRPASGQRYRDGDGDDALRRLLAYPSAADPYPLYETLRRSGPCYQATYGLFALTGHAEVGVALRHPGIGHDSRGTLVNYDVDSHQSLRQLANSIAARNPPAHTRLRRMISHWFSRDAVARRCPAISQQVAALLDETEELTGSGAPIDVMETAAFPLPIAVIADLLGVPGSDTSMLRGLVSDFTVMTEYSFNGEDLKRADRAAETLRDYFAALVAQRRAHPADDLLTAIVRDIGGSREFGQDGLIAMCMFLFAAGFETTANTIGKGLVALLRHPDQLRRWRDDPGMTETAVEEIIRYDGYVHCVKRTTLTDVELGGKEVPAGRMVLAFLAAANRDPEVFSDPDRFHIGRRGPAAMTFSVGPHFCLGANLALAELRIFFAEFLRRFPVIELGGTPVWYDGLMLRGLKALPLYLRTA